MVIVSQAGEKFIHEIADRKMNIRVVKDGETLDLGERTLRFVSAPFLHWPDTMFTLVEGEEVIFTCDFFGAHYCEPRMLDRYVTYPERYEKALEDYYKAIFGPFTPYVRDGLELLEGMKFRLVCVSHGPVLTEATFENVRAKYKKWSEPHKNEKTTVEIFYCSAYGCTQRAAEKVRDGILGSGPRRRWAYDIIVHDWWSWPERFPIRRLSDRNAHHPPGRGSPRMGACLPHRRHYEQEKALRRFRLLRLERRGRPHDFGAAEGPQAQGDRGGLPLPLRTERGPAQGSL